MPSIAACESAQFQGARATLSGGADKDIRIFEDVKAQQDIHGINPAYSRHSSCNLSDMCPLSSTQRCWTYIPRIAHAREPQQCSVGTGILDIVVCGHWQGVGSCPSQYRFHTSYLGQTLHEEFCIMYNPKSEPPTEQ